NLKWETSETWGLGFDMTVFNKLNLTFDYYNRTTSDILMEVPTPDTYALEKFIDNVGKVRNTGIELSASYAQQVGEVKLNFSGNFAYNRNKILQLAGQKEIIKGNDINHIGYSLNSLYGYEAIGFYQSQEDVDTYAEYKLTGKPQAGDLKYKDQNNDGVLDGKDRVIMGTKDPKYVFGLNIGAEWKGFDFTAFFQGAAGVKRYMDGTVFGDFSGDSGKPNVIWRDHWTPENPNATMPRLTANTTGPSMPALSSTFWMQNANYVRLKNIQIGYTLPAEWLAGSGISRLRIYYSGQNLFTMTKFIDGWDPEAPSGRGSHYPQVMVNSFGLNLTF
ncbi:MAG: TonB-dependent receptor domain-containing protein, partial [Tannerellaceae bacterium]